MSDLIIGGPFWKENLKCVFIRLKGWRMEKEKGQEGKSR